LNIECSILMLVQCFSEMNIFSRWCAATILPIPYIKMFVAVDFAKQMDNTWWEI